MSEQNQYVYEFGPFRLDAQKRLLLREGEIVPLKPKAFDTLLALVGSGGHVVEKDELMRRVWPNTAVEEGNLTFNISSLRKALGDDPRRHEYIVTIPGEGYQFVAGVRATFDELVVHESTSITVEEEEEAASPIADDGLRIAETSSERKSLAANTSEVPERSESLTSLPQAATSKPQSARRGSMLVGASVIVIGVASALGIYWLISQRQARDSAAVAVPFRELSISRLTTSGKIKHAAISPDGKYVAYVTADAQGDSLWISHVASPSHVRIAGPAPTEYVSVTFARDGGSVYYLTLDQDKGHTTLYRVPVLGGPSSIAADDVGPIGFSPDGKEIAFIRAYGGESRLHISNLDGSNERTLVTLQNPQYFRGNWNAPAWSPEGKYIACQVRLSGDGGQHETVLGVSVEDGTHVSLTSERWAYVGQPVWLPDGSGLLTTANESETARSQVWHIALTSLKATRITHDINDYSDLTLTADSSKLLAVQDHNVSSIWVSSEAGNAKEVASEVGWLDEIAWSQDGRIIYRSNAGGTAEIWVMDADGSNPRQLTVDARATRGLTVSPDGRYLFFASDRAGYFNIWRIDSDGKNLKQLTNGDGELYPHCSPDGHWVVYQRGETGPRLWKVSTEGGEPVQVTDTRASRPAFSPDGQMIAYHYLDPEVDRSRWRIAVVSSAGGPRLRQFDFPPAVAPAQRFVRWTPDGQALAFPSGLPGASDIWIQPLDGTQPRRLTDFQTEQIVRFDWSRDGRLLAVIRKVGTSDAVLIGTEQKK